MFFNILKIQMTESEIKIEPQHLMIDVCRTKYKGTMTGNLMEMVMKWFPNAFLEYNREFSGYASDYIDKIYSRTLTSPIMWGFDEHDRAFIAIRTYKSRFETKDKEKTT